MINYNLQYIYIYMNDFDIFIYKNFNSELKYYDNKKLIEHYKNNGINENSIFSLKTLLEKNKMLKNFDLQNYKNNNQNLNFTNDLEYVLYFLNKKKIKK